MCFLIRKYYTNITQVTTTTTTTWLPFIRHLLKPSTVLSTLHILSNLILVATQEGVSPVFRKRTGIGR